MSVRSYRTQVRSCSTVCAYVFSECKELPVVAYRKKEVLDFIKARAKQNPEFWNTKLMVSVVDEPAMKADKKKEEQRAKKRGKCT